MYFFKDIYFKLNCSKNSNLIKEFCQQAFVATFASQVCVRLERKFDGKFEQDTTDSQCGIKINKNESKHIYNIEHIFILLKVKFTSLCYKTPGHLAHEATIG